MHCVLCVSITRMYVCVSITRIVVCQETQMADDSNRETEEVLVCAVAELVGNRKRIKIEDKDIIIIRNKGQVFALDSYCYHAGGPLFQGDIEDIGGRSCLVCPWHKYKVCVATGEMVYQACDPHNLKKPPVWKSSGTKQRTHRVNIRDGKVYVTFSECTGELQSDHYNCIEYRQRLGLT